MLTDGVPQQFGRMFGAPAGQMLDLLSAGDPRCDDLYLVAARLDCRNQPALTYFCGEIVMLFLEAEGAGHAAAAGVDFADFITGGFEHRYRGSRADERFLMTVPK